MESQGKRDENGKSLSARVWHKDCWRRFIIGHHIPDYDQKQSVPGMLEKVDPKKFVRELKQAGVEVFQIYAKCHYGNAYYNTKVGHKHSAIGDRDLFQEYITACRHEGIIPVCIYEWLDLRVKHDHPDWDLFFSPYREFSKKQVEEIVSGYDIEGLYMDMVDFNIDERNQQQQDAYRKEFGREMPTIADCDSKEWRNCVRWAYRHQRDFLQEIREIVAKLRPSMTVVHNHHIEPHMPYFWGNGIEESCEVDDFAWNDMFCNREGYLTVASGAKLFKSVSKLTPEILLDSTLNIFWRKQYEEPFTAKYKSAYLAEAMTLIGNGVTFQSGIGMRHDGTWNKTAMETIGYVNDEIAKVQDVVKNSRPLKYAAIVYSERTRDFHGGADKLRHARSYYGMFSILQQSHIPFDVMPDFQITDKNLAGYKLLVLPSIVCMSDSTAEAIKRFVEGGGIVVATDLTSMKTEEGTERKNFALAEIFGVEFDSVLDYKEKNVYIEPETKFACREEYIAFQGTLARIRPTNAVTTLCHAILRPKGLLCVAIGERTASPFAVSKRSGKGECIYIAGDFGSAYGASMLSEYKELCGNILRTAINHHPFVVEAPSCIEAIFSENIADNSINVFLINLQVDMKRCFFEPRNAAELAFAPVVDEILPVYDVKIHCDMRNIDSVVDLVSGQALEWKKADGKIEIKIPKVEVYCAIKINK